MTNTGSHVWANGLQALSGCHASIGDVNWNNVNASTYTDHIRCELETAEGRYTSDVYINACTEITGTGYSTQGVRIDAASANGCSLDASGAYVNYTCTTMPQWTSATFEVDYAAIDAAITSSRSSSPVICCFDISNGGTNPKSVTSGTFTLTFGTTSQSVQNCVFAFAIQ